MKTYSIRIFPEKEQVKLLNELSSIRIEIYNFYLQNNINEYNTNKKIFSAYDMHKMFTADKIQYLNWSKLNAKCVQTTLTSIHNNYKSFFVLIKKDKTAKPPQPILDVGFRTICYNQSGWSIKKDNVIEINKIPFKYKSIYNLKELHIKEIRVKFVNNKWLVDLCCEEKKEYFKEKLIQNKVLAIDLGLEKLATGIDSNGNVLVVHNKPKKINKYFSKHINKIKSKQDKCKKYSKRWKHLQKIKNRKYHKKNSQIKQRLHIESNKIINMNYNTIIVGDLKVKKLMGLKESKYKKISKSFGGTNLTMFVNFLKYKALNHNINVVKVDESYTTQTNCLTGSLFDKIIKLSDRVVKIDDNIEIDRDLNSAVNIYKKYINNHLVALTPPLDLSNVLMKNNLLKANCEVIREPSVL